MGFKIITSKKGTIDLTCFWGIMLWMIIITICSLNQKFREYLNTLSNENPVQASLMMVISCFICIIISIIICGILERKKEGSLGLNREELKEFRKNNEIERLTKRCAICHNCENESTLTNKLFIDDKNIKLEYECTCGKKFYWLIFLESDSITQLEFFNMN